MGDSTDKKGIVIDVCTSTIEFLKQRGVLCVVSDNSKDIIVYKPTARADAILRKAFAEPDAEQSEQ